METELQYRQPEIPILIVRQRLVIATHSLEIRLAEHGRHVNHAFAEHGLHGVRHELPLPGPCTTIICLRVDHADRMVTFQDLDCLRKVRRFDEVIRIERQDIRPLRRANGGVARRRRPAMQQVQHADARIFERCEDALRLFIVRTIVRDDELERRVRLTECRRNAFLQIAAAVPARHDDARQRLLLLHSCIPPERKKMRRFEKRNLRHRYRNEPL